MLLLKIASRTLAKKADYVGLAGVLAALISLPYVPVGVRASGFIVDSFSLIGTGLVAGTLALVLIYSGSYLRRLELPRTEWTFLLISAALGLMLMFNTHHLLLLFIGLEISSLSFYVLCGYLRENRKSLESALKYFVLGSIGSAILLLGIALVFINQQTLVIDQFSYVQSPALTGFSLSLAVVVLGLLFKLSTVPLHFWVPDVYEGAPTPVTAFMSVAVKVAVLGALIRSFGFVDEFGGVDWVTIFWWGSAVTIVAGNVLALVQENLKRMLAYSSVAHGGYLLMGLVALNDRGYAAIVFYLLVYVLMNVLAFGVISMLSSDEDEYHYSDLRGLSEASPLLAAALAVSMISLSGLPPTAGFMGKLFLFYGVVQAGYPGLAVIAVLGSVVSVCYYFNVIVYAYMRDPAEDEGFIGLESGFLPTATAALSAAVILVLGVTPGLVYDYLHTVIEGLQSSL